MAARRRQAARRNWPANLYQNSNGYLWFKNPEDGRTVGLGTDLAAAISMVKRANLELARRKEERDIIAMLDASGVTLAQHCDAYEKEYAVGNKNTVSAMKSQLNAIRAAAPSKKPIAKFTAKDAADMVKDAIAERGDAMAGKIRSRLRDVFRDAMQHGIADKNPVDVILRPKVKVSRARMTIEDFWKIHAVAGTWLQNAMLLALVTGQRRDDICGMRFDDVRDGFLWLSQGKTGAKLKIPVSIGLEGTTLAQLVARCRDNVVSKYLVHYTTAGHGAKAGERIKPTTLSSLFARARDKAELSMVEGSTPTTFHEIRSLAARMYAEERGTPFAQALLGHKSSSMTDLYRDVRGQQWVEIKSA